MLKEKILKIAIILALTTSGAHAGTQIGATRVIHMEGKKESSVTINNKDASPYLIKSWIENSDSAAGTHFIVTPPLFRIDANQQNVIRIFKTKNELPATKESLFFLNVTSIPSSSGEVDRNTLQIAVRTKMKLIYRPKVLTDKVPEDFADKITWTKSGKTITAKNNSPYYMNFAQITLNGKVIQMAERNYVPPMSTSTYALPSNSTNGDTVAWNIINDFGGQGKTHKSTL